MSTDSQQQLSPAIPRVREHRVLRLFSDGSVIDYDRNGARWGGGSFVFEFKGEWLGRSFGIGSGVWSERAELHAIREALKWAQQLRLDDAELFTSVQVLCDCVKVVSDIDYYRTQGTYPHVTGRAVLAELWKLQDDNCDVVLTYVRGHDGNEANDFADFLAKQGACAAKREGNASSSYSLVASRPKTRFA